MNKKWFFGAITSLILILLVVLWKSFSPNSFKLDATATHAISIQEKHVLSVDQFKEKQNNNTQWVVIDIRTDDEYRANPFKDAVNIPFAEVLTSKQLADFKSKNQEMLIYSGSLIESAQAWTILTQMGYKNLYILDFTGATLIEGTLIDSISSGGNTILK